MATNYSTSTIADSTTTANMASWAQFVEDTLVTVGGWTLTNDTGQTLPSALTPPTANSQKRGYRIYNMADHLQAQYPVFMRIDYGSGNLIGTGFVSPPYTSGLFLTIGTGSDGNGNITGVMLNSFPVSGIQPGGAQQSFGSADKNRFTIAMFVPFNFSGSLGGNVTAMVFGVERWKDESGTDIGGGLMVVASAGIGGSTPSIVMEYSPCLAFGAAAQQPIDAGLNFVHTTTDPSPTYFGDRGVGVLFHFRGTVIQPGTNFLICNMNDVQNNAYVFVNIYGRIQTYQNVPQIYPIVCGIGSGLNIDGWRKTLMRYD